MAPTSVLSYVERDITASGSPVELLHPLAPTDPDAVPRRDASDPRRRLQRDVHVLLHVQPPSRVTSPARLSLMADRSPRNAQLGADLAQGPALGFGCTFNVHGATATSLADRLK